MTDPATKNVKIQGFILYRIFYGDTLVYVGRTKQPLQSRIRGHLFAKPMHRTIAIEQVTKIEYAMFQTEADMNLYEIYFILKWHPPLNVDDKTKDYPTVELPPVVWTAYHPPLWDKWLEEISVKSTEHEKMLRRYRAIPEEISILRSTKRIKSMTEEEYLEKLDRLREEREYLHKKLWN